MTFIPLVRGKTTATSPNVGSLMDELDGGTYYVPDYQRDSEQWNISKRSLFIESLLNNLTIPPLIVYPEDDDDGTERHQIIDGQQRLTTIRDFVKDRFALANEDDVEYAENIGPIIQGKKFSELPEEMRSQIRRYVLNLIVLPKNLDLGLRLEIFRRINEGGVPLSSQDLRLATFGQSDRVFLIRLAGVFDPKREGSARMISAGEAQHKLSYPWKNHAYWKSWWQDTAQSAGQAASQAFLYYVIARDLLAVDQVIMSNKLQQALGIKYDKTTTSVLDLYMAQLDHEQKSEAPRMAAGLGRLRAWFEDFESWFNVIKGSKIPRVLPNSSTKLAFFIAAATQEWKTADDLSEAQWEYVQLFLTKGPADIKNALGMEFPSTRGKWPGQKRQIERTFEICKKIAKI